MGSRKTLAFIGFLTVLAAGLCLAPALRTKGEAKVSNSPPAGGAGAAVAAQPFNNSGNPAGPTVQPRTPALGSQPAVAAGGAGAGKAKINMSAKLPRASDAPSEVLEAAVAGLPFFLGRIPPGSKELYGFSPADDLSQAQLGRALRMHTITPAVLENSSSTTPVSSMLSETCR
jgi:hypothetical protein